MGRTGPDTALLARSIEASTDLPIGSVVEMASNAPVVDDKYILAEGGLYSATEWPALAEAMPYDGVLNTSVPLGKALPFCAIIAVRVCNDVFAMLTGAGVYTSPDGLTWTLRQAIDANYSYTLERTGDGGLVLFGTDGKIYASSNAADWTLLASLPNKTIKYMDRIGGTYYLSDGLAIVQKTTDFATFANVFTAGANVTGIYCGAEVCVYCATTYYTSSGGVTSWSSATVGVASNHISRKSNGDIVRTVNGTGAILFSSNGGTTWSTFNPINTGTTLPAYDYTNVGDIGNVVVKSGGDTSTPYACICFNNTPNDPTSTYTAFKMHPDSVSYFLGSLYDGVEANTTKILFYKKNSNTGSALRAISKPATSFVADCGARLLPFIFGKQTPVYNKLSSGVSTEKIGDTTYLHTCVSYAGQMTNNTTATYYALPFVFTEDSLADEFAFYDYTNALGDLSDAKIKPLRTILDGSTLTILFAKAAATATYIYAMRAVLGSTDVPNLAVHTTASTASLDCNYVWVLGPSIFFEEATTGPLKRIVGTNAAVTISSLTSKLTASKAPSLWDDGTISYVFTNSTASYDLYVSKDGGLNFSLFLTGAAQAAYAPMSKAVAQFNGYYWALGTSTLFRDRKLGKALLTATATAFSGSAPVDTAINMTVIADGRYLMCCSLTNVYLIDKQDNVFTIPFTLVAPHVPSIFFNDKAVIPTTGGTGIALAAAGDATPDGYIPLPFLEPSAPGLHKYLKGA